MPLPLGHTVLGLTTHHLVSRDTSVFKKWKLAVLVTVLGSLPDIDVLIGLIFFGNGNAIHRGPTHSLLFALVAGFVISRALRWAPGMPQISFKSGSLVILSHLVADFLFTSSPVSFFFPFENLVSTGYSGWGDVVSTVFYDNIKDANIIFYCVIIISLNLIGTHIYRAVKGQGGRSKAYAAAPVKPASRS